jgi:hypothetical protein
MKKLQDKVAIITGLLVESVLVLLQLWLKREQKL